MHRPSRQRPQISRGFTLLEVLVAVFVLAIAMAAIISAGGNYARSATLLRDRTLALWVAHDRLTEIELQPQWPQTGTGSDDVVMGSVGGNNIVWTWRTKVQETPDPMLHRIDIRVEKKNDSGHYAYAELSSFISRVGRTVPP